MSKEYILQYIRDLKSVIDYHVTNGIPIGNAVDPELQAVCDKLIQSGTTLEPQFMNEMYKYIIYLENVKTDPKYIKVRNQFQGIHLEFFISMMLMNTTRIILEYENA